MLIENLFLLLQPLLLLLRFLLLLLLLFFVLVILIVAIYFHLNSSTSFTGEYVNVTGYFAYYETCHNLRDGWTKVGK